MSSDHAFPLAPAAEHSHRYHAQMMPTFQSGPTVAGKHFAVRIAVPGDAEAIVRLAGQLGYATTVAAVLSLIEAPASGGEDGSRGSPASVVYVARDDVDVRGWMEVRVERSLLGSWAEIIGLIIDDGVRGRGIGSELVDHAVRWAREQGQTRLRVRTNTRRTRAATFYQGLCFVESKQQRIFERAL